MPKIKPCVEEDLRTGVESLPTRSKTPQKRQHPSVFHGEIGGICEEGTPAAAPATPVQKKRRDSLSPGCVDQAPTAVVNPSPEAPLQRCERQQNQQRTPDPEANGSPDVPGHRAVTTVAEVHAVPPPRYLLATPRPQTLPSRSVSPAPRTPLVVPEKHHLVSEEDHCVNLKAVTQPEDYLKVRLEINKMCIYTHWALSCQSKTQVSNAKRK
ncbi:uncharacterized protein LOC127375270 [Dicentrarchus labrax]|uniref:uncharacterized protein LOC127375270 n=1 Tax=Dicentrarchus labrax TaxID=13489 RepID=UPI0021F53521|nr:uncharacterized protein LOC127375270 [Dicentrarchus labrax]